MHACLRAKRERNFVIEAFKLRLGDSVAETGLVVDRLFPLPFPFASIPLLERQLTMLAIRWNIRKVSAALQVSLSSFDKFPLIDKYFNRWKKRELSATSEFRPLRSIILLSFFFLRTLITARRRLPFSRKKISPRDFNPAAPPIATEKLYPRDNSATIVTLFQLA